MTKPQPSSVTAEEAVARLVNMDYIPDGCTLLEMTAAFLEEAEADFENAKLEPRSAAERDRLYRRVEICRCRDRLAEQLLADLRKELEAPDQSQITCTTDGTAITRVTTASVWQWAADRYGLGVPDWEPPTAATLPDDARWEDITIKIYADHRLGWSHKGEGWRTARFEDVGLMGKKHRSPNAQGVVLTALSAGRKFPATSQLSGNERTIMTRLRTSLRQLTGLRKGEPFKDYNEPYGYEPSFVLIDDRRNADERAKREAIHVPFSEARDFEREDDDAQKFIDDHERR